LAQEVNVWKALHHRREINKAPHSRKKGAVDQHFSLPSNLHRLQKKQKASVPSYNPNFTALQLLNDPQSFTERLYDSLSQYDKQSSLDHKILLRMQLLSESCVMGAHKLFIIPFYMYILKYLTHCHQLHVPAILVALA
jgi:protein SDA1